MCWFDTVFIWDIWYYYIVDDFLICGKLEKDLWNNWSNWLTLFEGCKIPLQHLATSSLGNNFWRHLCFSPKQPEPQTHGDFNISLLKQQNHDFCYTMVNISPLHIQQCLILTMHFLLRHLAAKMLSQLYHNFILFPYFFPYCETCCTNVNPLFHAAIKNLHIKPNGIFFLLLHLTPLPFTLCEEVT